MADDRSEAKPFTSEDLVQILHRQSQAGDALVVAGLVEDEIQKLLLTAGRTLSNKQAQEIFGGLGPLHGFSAKIEIAYMFELIDQQVRDDLQVIKSIRNKFAHTTSYVFFDSPHVDKDCRRLSNWKRGIANEQIFRRCAVNRVNIIRSSIDRFMMVKALKEPPGVVED